MQDGVSDEEQTKYQIDSLIQTLNFNEFANLNNLQKRLLKFSKLSVQCVYVYLGKNVSVSMLSVCLAEWLDRRDWLLNSAKLAAVAGYG